MGILDAIRDFNRPVLSDRTIMKYNKKGLLFEDPISPEQLQPNSVDLTLGNTWRVLKPNRSSSINGRLWIDPKEPIEYKKGFFNTDDHNRNMILYDIPANQGLEWYVIQPKQFVLMASNEILNIPNGIISFVQGRSSIARLAIQTEQAGLIDAGFRGTITFEVFNQSEFPIVMYKGMRIAQVYFFKAQYADKVYGAEKKSKYYDQIEATGSRIHLDSEFHKK